jgi:hypothetical protein
VKNFWCSAGRGVSARAPIVIPLTVSIQFVELSWHCLLAKEPRYSGQAKVAQPDGIQIRFREIAHLEIWLDMLNSDASASN